MTAIIGLGGILILLGMLLYFAKKAGRDEIGNEIGKQNAEASKRIADAHGDSPVSLSDLREQLRVGSRKL